MKKIVFVGAVLIVALALVYFFVNRNIQEPAVPSEDIKTDDETSTKQEETAYGFSYEYEMGENGYTLHIPPDAVRGDLVFTQSVFDSTDYADLQEGNVPREAPASLTMEVYRNPLNQDVREWITSQERSNYHLSPNGTISTVKKGVTDFLTYQYDGLYRTDAYVYGKDGYIYVFANMWDNPESAMKLDMERLLESIRWSTPQILASIAHGDISISAPEPNSVIVSPLTIEGEARGFWFFEASFPMTLVDWDGKIIAEGIATAEEEWMTEDFVPFSGELVFTKPPQGETGSLILRKDNPSGIPENDDAIEIPVRFE